MELMGFATINNSKSVWSTNRKFARKKDIGVTVKKMQKKTKFQNFGVNGFCQMTAVVGSNNSSLAEAKKTSELRSDYGGTMESSHLAYSSI